MTREERRQSSRELGRLFHVEKMSSTGEDERLDMWQPLQEQLVPMVKPRIATLAQNSEDGLMNAAGLARSKGPHTQRRELVREESVRVG